ncbi:MAG: leucine-rich repeat domain-containing protein [Alistipes sp.]|nr:leucine-rich repeat domain-containing protein [Alistipes sp.]
MKIFKVLFALLAFALIACEEHDYGTTPETTVASLGTPENNEIWFTTTDGKVLLNLDETAFNVAVAEVIYSEYDINVIRFAGEVTTIGEGAFEECTNIFNLSLPNSVQSIGDYAFYDCKNMECLTLGEGIRSCGAEAFEGCYNLRSLHIPSIYSWCRIAFANRNANPLYFAEHLLVGGTKVTSLNIPMGIENINDYAFTYAVGIKDVTIPSTLKSIGKDAFEGCDNIDKVHISSIKAWCNIDFESEWANPLSLARNLYLDGAKVSDVDVSGVKNIYSYTFINCDTIHSFKADNALENIGKDSFRNCSALTSVSLGAGIKSIGKQAFMNCKALASFTCYATTPPALGNNDVFSLNAEGRKFFVPSASLNAYKEQWSKYATDIEPITE